MKTHHVVQKCPTLFFLSPAELIANNISNRKTSQMFPSYCTPCRLLLQAKQPGLGCAPALDAPGGARIFFAPGRFPELIQKAFWDREDRALAPAPRLGLRAGLGRSGGARIFFARGRFPELIQKTLLGKRRGAFD